MIKRICFHSTAGVYKPTASDIQAYHFIVDDIATVHHGRFKPEDNTPPLRSGHYAAHCGWGNSYTLGIAGTGMSANLGAGHWERPHTRVQLEKMWEIAADWCKRGSIIVNPDTVYTHAEFGKRGSVHSPSHGKIDITFIPFDPSVKPEDVGEYMRNKVKWYIGKR